MNKAAIRWLYEELPELIVYRRSNEHGKKNAYINVRIKDGTVVIESLYVAGLRIEDAVKREMAK